MRPIRLDVIAHTFEGLGVCTSCELVMAQAGVGESPMERALQEYPPEWQAELHRLTDWVHSLAADYGGRLVIRVIDPQSPEGLIKSIRHRVRQCPAWIIEGKRRVTGWDRAALDVAIRAAGDQENDGG